MGLHGVSINIKLCFLLGCMGLHGVLWGSIGFNEVA